MHHVSAGLGDGLPESSVPGGKHASAVDVGVDVKCVRQGFSDPRLGLSSDAFFVCFLSSFHVVQHVRCAGDCVSPSDIFLECSR